ncbi:hypothetical protein X975_03644, partial [Stegodyphus mimosarum]
MSCDKRISSSATGNGDIAVTQSINYCSLHIETSAFISVWSVDTEQHVTFFKTVTFASFGLNLMPFSIKFLKNWFFTIVKLPYVYEIRLLFFY